MISAKEAMDLVNESKQKALPEEVKNFINDTLMPDIETRIKCVAKQCQSELCYEYWVYNKKEKKERSFLSYKTIFVNNPIYSAINSLNSYQRLQLQYEIENKLRQNGFQVSRFVILERRDGYMFSEDETLSTHVLMWGFLVKICW